MSGNRSGLPGRPDQAAPRRLALLAGASLFLAGCQSTPEPPAVQTVEARLGPAGGQSFSTLPPRTMSGPETRVQLLEGLPEAGRKADNAPSASELTLEQLSRLVGDEPVRATLPPQPVPQFIDTMFGQIFEVPYVMGRGVADVRDIVSIRGPVSGSRSSLVLMTQLALREYGIAMSVEDGVVNLRLDEFLSGEAPLVVRTRSSPETPESSRVVVQFFELQAIDAGNLQALLTDVFPDIKNIKVIVRQDINSIVMIGRARDIAAAADIIAEIDKPRLSGAQVARVEPVYWSADALAAAVTQALQTEGYQALGTSSSVVQRAVNFMPVPFTNQVLIFSNIPEAFDRALYWVRELDRPSALGDQESVFVYTVRNTSAAELGRLVATVNGDTASIVSASMDSAGDAGRQRSAAVPSETAGAGPGGRITIDAGGNRILYRGTPNDFERTRRLLEQLDTPPLQVLVEVTIAEVTLTDETRFGVEWFLDEVVGEGRLQAGTLGSLGLSSDGLSIGYVGGSVQVALSALASNNNVNILSTPRIVARSGGLARIQVGTDVPIITSQRAADTQVGGNTDILQTVQYRQTGVILDVEPIVFGDRVDINLSQEVSSQQNNSNAAVASPLILNRSVQTQISLKEGTTAVIGGLMQDQYTRGNTGVPILKDVPFLGALFRADSLSQNKTELLLMLTPYIIRTGDELDASNSGYAASINDAFRQRGPHAYTLLPWPSSNLNFSVERRENRSDLDIPQEIPPPAPVSGEPLGWLEQDD